MDLLSMQNRTVLITGAGSGMGRAASVLFASRGARILGLDISSAGLDETAAAVAPYGSPLLSAVADVANSGQVDAAVTALVSGGGPPDVLLNLAGIASKGAVDEISDTEWRRVLGIHLDGTFYVSRAVVPLMKQRRHGRIVNMSSTFGLHGGLRWAAYAAAKGAVAALTKSMAKDLAPFSITANALAPGSIATPMQPERTPSEMKQRLSTIPLGRMGTPTEVASLLLFLSSDESAYITGQIIKIDGGEFI